MAANGPVLEVRSMTVRYGGVSANDSIDLVVDAGTIVGLIGPNGAGKTTFVDAVTGFTPSRGEVLLDGRAISRARPHHRLRQGLSRTWQSVELFADLTVIENILVSAHTITLRSALADLVVPARRRVEQDAAWALELLGLAAMANHRPAELSLGHQKLVGVARALASRPRVVLLDEPAAGLDSSESERLGEQIRQVGSTGTTVVLIDHDMKLVLDLCDVVHVLEFGRLIASGPPAEIRTNELVQLAYLGSSGSSVEP